MRDFSAIGLILAVGGLLTAGFTGSRRTGVAITARENAAKLRGVCLPSRRTDRRI
jgi:hypothetical protein